MRLNLVRALAAASACLLSWSVAVASAPTPIGGTAFYSDSSNGALFLANFDSGTFMPLGTTGNAYGTFGGSGAVYSRFDPVSGQNAFYYREYGEGKPEKTLFSGAWMSYFDPKTGDFAYSEYDPATSEQRHYKGNLTSESTPELVLTGTSVWISSWSENMDRYVYMAYDATAGSYSSTLVDVATGQNVGLGASSSQSGTVWTNVSYRFVRNENLLYRYEYQYDSSDWSSHNSVSVLDVSDFSNPVSTSLGFDLGNNGSILGRRGNDLFYVTYDQNWVQTYHVRKADGTTKDFPMPSWPIYDYSTGEMAGFGTYLVFSSWNPETGKNSVKYLDYETGETGEFLSGQYVQAPALNLSPALPCEGDFLACGLPFKTYAELKAFPAKRYSNVLGFAGTAYSGAAGVSYSQPAGFQGGGAGSAAGTPSYGSPAGFGGTAYSGTAVGNGFAAIGFVGSPNLSADLKAPSRFSVVGHVGDTYSAGDVSRRISVSSPIGSYGSPVKNTGLVGKYAPIGCFRDDWSGVPSDSSENPQREMPKNQDAGNLALSSSSPWETVFAKLFNQAAHVTQQLVDQIDPVDLSTGEFTYDNVLMRLPGATMPFELSVKYRSRTTYDGPMGWNWSHSYDQKLKENRDGSVTYVDGGLQNFTFKAEGGAYGYLKGLEASLSRKPEGGFAMDFLDGSQKTFDSSGMITRIADKDGNALALAYDAKSRLTEVRDSLNRKFAYSYGTNGRISKVADPYGRAVEFDYFDENSSSGSLNDLESVTVDNGDNAKKTIRFTYVAGLYPAEQLHNLVTLTDSKGQEYVRNEYAFTDRVVSQKFGDGSGRFDYAMSPMHEDDTPDAVGSGQIVGYYVSRNFAINKRGIGTEYRFDRMGNVTSRTTYDLVGTGTTRTAFEYDSVGRLLKEVRPSGAGTAWKYDSDGNKTEERKKEDASLADNDFTDLVTKYEYGTGATAKLVAKSVSPDGTATRYSYDGKRRLVKTETDGVILSLGADSVTVTTEMEYDGLGRLVKVTDPAGRTTEYAYSGSLLASTHKGGVGTESVTEAVEYDKFGNPVKAVDGEGNISTVAYDAFGRAVATESAEGVKKRFSYDLNDNKLSDETEVSSGTWASTQYSYDVLDKPVSVSADLGDGRTATVMSFYDGNGNVRSTVAPGGKWKGVEYDAFDRPVAWKERPNAHGLFTSSGGALVWTAGEERTISAEYDADGNVTKKTDAKGNVWTYSYDGFGRATSTVSPEGTETRVAYDKAGNAVRTSVISGTGLTVSSMSATFNALGKPLSATAYSEPRTFRGISATSPDDRTAKTDYNPDGSVARTYDPEGNYVTYSYDPLGRISSVRDPLGNETRTSYDRRGLAILTRSVGNDGKTVSVYKTYDKDGRPTETRQSEGGTELVTRVAYNRLGNMVEKTDPEGRKTSYSYDWRGLLLAETDALGGTVSRTYDLAGRKTSQTDAEGRTTLYSYSPFGEPASETLPDGSAYSWTYDANGNAVTSSDPNGNAITTAYDKENRPVRKDVLAGSGVLDGGTLSYSYDSAGRLASATGTDGKSVSYSYDAFGGISSETSGGKTVSHSYGRKGLETGTALPSGRTLSYSYDAAGRTSSIGSAPAGGSPGNLASYSYAGNLLSSVSYGNGTSESRSYDAFGRLSALSLAKGDASKVRDWAFAYDKTGNPLSDGTDSWEYDPLYRLKGVSYGLSGSGTGLPFPETFAYSANGNRTSRGFGHPDGSSSGSTSYYANQLDQYVSADKAGTSGTGSDAYSYDPNGNLVETARYRFAYDWANRLVRVTEKARTVLVGSGTERKEIWLGSETDSGSAIPPSDPPPADTGTSSGSETPPADTGTSSGTEAPPADTGSGTADASANGNTETSSGSTETGTGAETQSGTTGQGTGSGGTSSGATDPGTGADSGSGSSETPSGATGTGSGTESGTGGETGSGTGTGTGETSSGSTETQSGATSSGSTDSGATAPGSTESGSTVTEITYPERLIAEYSYDALGRRVSKALSDRTVSYSYDGQKIIEETASDLSGSVIRSSEFAYGAGDDDDVLAEFRTESGTTTTFYFTKDRLGSIAAVTDGSGNVLEEYRYSAFGSPYRKLSDGTWEALGSETETLSGTVRPGPQTDRLYAGREWDSETGLFHYRARAYSPEFGRFLQRDPVGTADQMNPYAYVRNNPLTWTDPTGAYCIKSKQIIHSATEQFNSEGIMYEHLSLSSTQSKYKDYVDILAQSWGFGADVTRMHQKNDGHASLNWVLGVDTTSYSNYKRDNYYKKLSDNAKDCMKDENVGCYFETDDGYRGYLADIGDMALGYNAAKAGLSMDHLKDMTLKATEHGELANVHLWQSQKRKEALARSENHDKQNYIFYEAGYSMGQMTETGKLTDETFRKYLEYAIKNGSENRIVR